MSSRLYVSVCGLSVLAAFALGRGGGNEFPRAAEPAESPLLRAKVDPRSRDVFVAGAEGAIERISPRNGRTR